MKHSTRYSVAIHCMLVIALYGQGTRLTSEIIARAVGRNAVTIRNIFQQPQESGLIIVRRGTGGVRLGRDVSEITLWDIFCAVQSQPVDSLMPIHENPYPQCPVGKCIRQVLEEPYARMSTAVQEQLQAYTIQMLLARYEEVRQPDSADNETNTTDA